jgi:hypothetical protein
MITPDEAEALARKHMQDYVAACGRNTVEDVGNALLKLASVTGVGIVATQGQEVAVAMIQGVAKHLQKPQFSKRWTMGTVN